MGRKIISFVLCGILLSASITVDSRAKEAGTIPLMADPALMTKDESLEEGLESAIMAVKAKIKIPKEYSEFNYYYYGSSAASDIYWSLNWASPKDYSYIEVSLDKDYNFVYYSNYDGASRTKGIPSYLKRELKDEAEDFIRQIAPDIYPNLDFVEANYNGIYSNTYSYHFQRKENNVIFPDNTVTVRVDAETGKIKSASIEWLRNAKIPPANTKLSKEEAAILIGQNLNMNLTYKINYFHTYNKGKNELVKKAFLVYEPDIGYISIDANSGEVYLNRSQWVEKTSDDMKADTAVKESQEEAKDAGAMLTEEEISKIRELESLISKEKAIEIVTTNPYLYIDENLLTYSVTLNKSYTANDKDNSYVWNIILRDEKPIDYSKDQDHFRAYANATVDAKTGKILSFKANLRSNYDSQTGTWNPIEVKYDRKYGQDVFEKFLNDQVKKYFTMTKLVDQRYDYVAYYKEGNVPVYGGYSYQYNRYNEGVEFPYNGINGAVDGVTGKIYYYNINWDHDIIFESPKNAMTPKEAFDHYISKDGFDLLYEINIINQYDPNYKSNNPYYDYSDIYSVSYEIRLVYRPDIYPTYICPFTGKQLNASGEVYKETEPYLYKDIADIPINYEILLLADMNIGFEGDNFNPDSAITEGEMHLLLEELGYWTSDRDLVSESKKLITKEMAAYDLIKRLGLEKVAKIKGIYKTGYSDEDDISPDYLGAVALAKGLNLFPAQDDNKFNPKDYIRRREAVSLILNLIKAERDNIY